MKQEFNISVAAGYRRYSVCNGNQIDRDCKSFNFLQRSDSLAVVFYYTLLTDIRTTDFKLWLNQIRLGLHKRR